MNYYRVLWGLYRQKCHTKWSSQQLRKLQDRRLRKILEYACQHSAYYHQAFEAAGIGAENIHHAPLSAFPTLNKEQLMENFNDLVTDSTLKQEDLHRFDKSSTEDLYKGKYHVVQFLRQYRHTPVFCL